MKTSLMTDHDQPDYDTRNDDKQESTIKTLKILLGIICLLLIASIIVIIILATGNKNNSCSNSSSSSNSIGSNTPSLAPSISPSVSISTTSKPITNGYVLDGNVWHTIFYRMTNESGINLAISWCKYLKELNKNSTLPTISIHCGIQNSIEQVSFGPHGGYSETPQERALEYGFAFTFNTDKIKNSFIKSNNIYQGFRGAMNIYRNYTTVNYKGIWIFDWTHGYTNISNMRASSPLKPVKINSTWHFCYFKFKTDDYTSAVMPTIIDNYRDLENTIISPTNSSKLLVTLFAYGQQNSLENLSFGSHYTTNNVDNSTQYGHASSYDTYNEKEFMVGANHAERPVYDKHHDLFKRMIGTLHKVNETWDGKPFFGYGNNNIDGVFVFDFTDDIIV